MYIIYTKTKYKLIFIQKINKKLINFGASLWCGRRGWPVSFQKDPHPWVLPSRTLPLAKQLCQVLQKIRKSGRSRRGGESGRGKGREGRGRAR
jgi:hypothetical protein